MKSQIDSHDSLIQYTFELAQWEAGHAAVRGWRDPDFDHADFWTTIVLRMQDEFNARPTLNLYF